MRNEEQAGKGKKRRGEAVTDTHRYLSLCGTELWVEQFEGLCILGFQMHSDCQ